MERDNKDQARVTHVHERRREFLRRTLATTAYAAPVILSFSTRDLVKAASGSGSFSSMGSPGLKWK
ncbi:MAG TPA: hypothetical protein PLP42_02750 [Acidobacteriota bacterium]|nr:hypothetical protein [Acidobacteriota bacterium]